MQETYPIFTKEMKKTHTILIPGMLPLHFTLLRAALRSCGFKAEVLQNTDRSVVDTGLKYVNNDICYPALLVIGQFINALESGKYDPDKVALIITQTGGGCRASNYIYLLRKGLAKAGFGNVPVISLNVSGMEDQPGFDLSATMLRRFLAAVIYGDTLMYLLNKTRPYEAVQGAADELAQNWLRKLDGVFQAGKAHALSSIQKLATAITHDFADLPVNTKEKIKVGIVGEIYIKYAALGNNNLEKFLQKQNCEYMVPGLLNFIMYCADTYLTDYKLYGGSLYDLAAEEGLDERILGELDGVTALLNGDAEYLHLLSIPSIPKKERCALLDEAFRGQVHLYVLNFMKLLCEKGALRELPGCARAYRLRYNEAHGILEATAVSAVPLTAEQTRRLHEKLEKVTGRHIDLKTKVEPAVLGGIRLDIEGTELDGTVRSRLAGLRSSIAAATL